MVIARQSVQFLYYYPAILFFYFPTNEARWFKTFFIKRGWTPDGPQEDGDEEVLAAPGDKQGGVDDEGLGEATAKCKLEREGSNIDAKGPEHRQHLVTSSWSKYSGSLKQLVYLINLMRQYGKGMSLEDVPCFEH